MIKINLVREGRAVRGAGAAPGVAAAAAAAGPSNLNNILILGGLIIGVVVAFGWWFIENRKLADRKDTVQAKTAEAQRLDSIIKEVEQYQKRKDGLQKRIDLINQLKQNQKGPVRIMDQISRDLPDLVWLDKMTLSGGVITLDGRALNPNAIANFVENIKGDPFFEEPDLKSVTSATAATPVYAFSMSFKFTYGPKGEAGAAGTTTAGTAGTAGTAATAATSATTGTRR